MDDILGLLAGAFLFAILVFIVPANLFSNRLDNTLQNVVNGYVNEFTDTCRATGEIEPEQYIKLLNKLDSTGYAYNIDIEHTVNAVYPIEAADGTVTDTARGGMNYSNKEILNEMFLNSNVNGSEQNDYKMQAGDEITVTVQSRTNTFSSKLNSLLTGAPGTKITASSGGFVYNDPQ